MQEKDYSDSADFLAQFFGTTTTHAVEIRALPQESGAGPAKPRFTRDPQIIIDHLEKWDGPGRACYFGVATRLTGRPTGRREDLAELPALWVDIDCYKSGISKDEAVSACLSLEMRPSLLVDSGGGIHAYWLLSEAIDVTSTERDDEIIAVLKQLAGVLAGDLGVCDLARIMRLPGTHNTKNNELRLCCLYEASSFELRYEFSDIREMLEDQRILLEGKARDVAIDDMEETDPYLKMARLAGPKVNVDRTLSMISYHDPKHPVNPGQFQVVTSLKGRGATVEEVVERIMTATQESAARLGIAHQWDWREEERQIRDMYKRSYAGKDRVAPPAAAQGGEVVQLRPVEQAKPQGDPDLDGLVHNDRANGLLLVSRFGSQIRYIESVGWHAWDGRRYRHDLETIAMTRLAHQISEELQRDAEARQDKGTLKWAIQTGNSGRLKNMIHEAKPYVKSDNDVLDRDPFLLNCLNGTVDLRTGGLREHRHADLITKLIPLDFDPDAPCPIWEGFLDGIFGGDADLIDFVHRAIGYSFTGDCREQVIFILHGLGSNGKSVLLETLGAVLGDYIKHTGADTFMEKQYGGGASNDIAALIGARFVSAVETERGHNIAEALIKKATGGDQLTARFLYREQFTYQPQFKLWLATNYKPTIRGSDLAIWRRIRLVPFNETFVDADKLVEGQRVKDPDIKAKLAQELPGILAWAVRGARAWLERGLTVPQAVENAIKLYQESQNPISKFIGEACHLSRGITGKMSELYDAYQAWCAEIDEEPVSKKAFGKTLDEAGYASFRGTDGLRLRKGIDLTEKYREIARNRSQSAG